MDSHFNELGENTVPLELSIKFAGLLIDMVRRVKANRRDALERRARGEQQTNVEYFIHTNDLKDFFGQAHNNLKLYVPISVGQPYHEGDSAASQVACLFNCRDSYESYLQGLLTQHAIAPKKTRLKWEVSLVLADVTQALNKLPPVEIQLDTPIGQCNRILTDENLIPLESEFIARGAELERYYHELFSQQEMDRQKDVEVILRMRRSMTIRWSKLKELYKNPIIIDLTNKLEHCFKLGALAINARSSHNTKFPKEIEKIFSSQTFNNWEEDVKVNDLAYVIIETIMIHCQILPISMTPVEEIFTAMMYPGPLNMILDTGKKILSCVCKDLIESPKISDAKCIYLQAEKYDPSNREQDKSAALFCGKLDEDRRRALATEETVWQRKGFIQKAAPKDLGLKVANASMRGSLKDKSRVDEKKQSVFATGPYASFLNTFHEQCGHYAGLFSQLCNEEKLPWDRDRPIATILEFFEPILSHASPMATLDLFYEHSRPKEDSLAQKFIQLDEKFRERNDNQMRKECLIRVACRLVRFAVELQEEDENEAPLLLNRKKTRSISSNFFHHNLLEGDNVEGQALSTPIVRATSEQMPLIGCFFYISKILDLLGNNISLLNNHVYYPDPVATVEYLSNPDSQGSISTPLTQSN